MSISKYGRINCFLIMVQITRVCSSPSSSTTGFLTLIFLISTPSYQHPAQNSKNLAKHSHETVGFCGDLPPILFAEVKNVLDVCSAGRAIIRVGGPEAEKCRVMAVSGEIDIHPRSADRKYLGATAAGILL